MSIINEIKKFKRKDEYEVKLEEAKEVFNKQSESLKSIKDTAGLEEIFNYWERVVDSSEQFILNSSSETDEKKLNLARSRRSLGKEFIDFLTSRLSS